MKKREPDGPGSGWFNMKVPELTAEVKRDMLLLRNRAALDPKQFYKREARGLPKFFQACVHHLVPASHLVGRHDH